MSAIAMRNAVVDKYGTESFEAGYIQWVFSRRPTRILAMVYADLMGFTDADSYMEDFSDCYVD